jgi:hypothetical protein
MPDARGFGAEGLEERRELGIAFAALIARHIKGLAE